MQPSNSRRPSKIKFVLDPSDTPSDIQREVSIDPEVAGKYSPKPRGRRASRDVNADGHLGLHVKHIPKLSVSPENSVSPAPKEPGEQTAPHAQMVSVEMDEDEDDDPLPEIPIRFEEMEQAELDNKPGGNPSKYASNASSLNSKYPYAREISETVPRKLMELRWIGTALVVNIILIYFVMQLLDGIYVPVDEASFHSVGAVIFEIIMLVANMITSKALNDGAAALFGSRLCTRGTSAVVCGFYQAGPLAKLSFANQLSLNSSVRTVLTRASVLWFMLEMMLLISPISATALIAHHTVERRGDLNCIEFTQIGAPVDRGFPTIDAEIGFAELIFGTALGNLRSEMDVENTTFMIGPQIIGAVVDGDTIVGRGFTATILTKCLCTSNDTADSLVIEGVTASLAPDLMQRYNALGTKTKGLASIIETNETSITISSLLSGSDNCGGVIGTSFVPLCVTSITDHNKARITSEYMTDGTTASVAVKNVSFDQLLGKGDLTWLSAAITNIMGGAVNSFHAPPTIPGVLTPIFWWTSPDLMAIDPSLLEAGIETTFAILLRAGIQRTFSTRGNKCTHEVDRAGISLAQLQTYGYLIAMVILALQIFVTLLASLCFIPWLIARHPMGPGVRAVRENIYFTTLVSSSHAFTNFDQLCNAESHALWQNLDVLVRIGQPIGMQDDEVGRVALDRPKLITKMVNGKKYY